MERPKAIHLKKILGLTPDCDGDWYHYKYRNQWADYQETEKFYKQFPPEVGQTVVVLRTFYQEMLKPHVLDIEVIHERGGIIVNHNHQDYAGTLFLRNGQNWKAKRSQTWLVPAELYKDIPKKKKERWEAYDHSMFLGKNTVKELNINEMIYMMGSQDRFKETIDKLMEDGKNYPEAKKLLSLQLQSEQRGLDRGFIRGYTRAQNRFGKRLY